MGRQGGGVMDNWDLHFHMKELIDNYMTDGEYAGSNELGVKQKDGGIRKGFEIHFTQNNKDWHMTVVEWEPLKPQLNK